MAARLETEGCETRSAGTKATYNAVKQALIDERGYHPGARTWRFHLHRGRTGVAPAAAQAAKVDRQVRAARPNTTAANVGYEAELWQMADALRGSMDAAEYKHVVLGLIFLKYISDAFEESTPTGSRRRRS